MAKYFSGNGDSGESSLFDGRKFPKDDPVFELLGVLDQLSAQIGFAISLTNPEEIKIILRQTQITISTIMGSVGGAKLPDLDLAKEITLMEALINKFEGQLDHKHGFVLFGDSIPGAAVNLCRTQARTVERIALACSSTKMKIDTNLFGYFNRLSSFFYVISLFLDQGKKEK